MTGYAAFVVGSAVAAIAAGRVEFPFNFVQSDVVAAMLEVTVGTVAIAGGWFHFHLVGMAVVAEGAFMAGGAEPVVGGGVEAVVLDESRSMAESVKGFHRAFLLVFMAFGAVYLLSDGEGFRVGCGKAGYGFHLGAGGDGNDESGQSQKRKCHGGSHFFPPMPVKVIL